MNTNYQVSQKTTEKLWSNFERDLLGRGSPYLANQVKPMTSNELSSQNRQAPTHTHKHHGSSRYGGEQSSF